MAAQAAIAVHAVELVREQADALRAATLRLTDLLSRRQASEPDQRRLFAKDVVIDEAEQIRNSVDEILQVVRESKLQQIVTVLGKVFAVHLIRIWQCICRI
jgi:DNA topoisomerase VI subunit B